MQNIAKEIYKAFEILLKIPDLASKRWIYQQYDSQVMNDTIQIKGDAAIVRVHGGKKALAMSSDCTPRYVEADPFEGAKQAVAETYRNISAVGARPLAITNCLNFGNPQKPEIMGQIVRAVKGITEASQVLDYPVVSGNVSLYNETDGQAIQPTPAIGGVGLLKDLSKHSSINFKHETDEIFAIGKTQGHIDCSLYQREVLGVEKCENPPKVDLELEKKNALFVQELIERSVITACHDVSDGGLGVALFEMCDKDFGCEINLAAIKEESSLPENEILFAEDQARYVVTVAKPFVDRFTKKAKDSDIDIFHIGEVKIGNIIIDLDEKLEIPLSVFKKMNDEFLAQKLT